MDMDASMMLSGAPSRASDKSSVWNNGPRWDVFWLIGSALVVPVVLFFVWRVSQR